MQYHLICIHPFGTYGKGQLVTDQEKVEKLMASRDHHFVRIAAPADERPAPVLEE